VVLCGQPGCRGRAARLEQIRGCAPEQRGRQRAEGLREQVSRLQAVLFAVGCQVWQRERHVNQVMQRRHVQRRADQVLRTGRRARRLLLPVQRL